MGKESKRVTLPTHRVPTEHEEQRDFVRWWRQHPALGSILIYAIPNGGGRSKAQAAKLKSEGVTAGMPDLHIPELRLWLEFKRQKGGKVSPEQEEIHAVLRKFDTVFVCKGSEDAKKQVLSFLQNPMSLV
jgi:hypothetical protein